MHPLKCVCDVLYKKHTWNMFIKKTRCISPKAYKEPSLLSEYIIKSRRINALLFSDYPNKQNCCLSKSLSYMHWKQEMGNHASNI